MLRNVDVGSFRETINAKKCTCYFNILCVFNIYLLELVNYSSTYLEEKSNLELIALNYCVSHDTGHLEKLAKSQALYKHELDT